MLSFGTTCAYCQKWQPTAPDGPGGGTPRQPRNSHPRFTLIQPTRPL